MLESHSVRQRRPGFEAVSPQPPVQLRSRQSEAARRLRLVPVGLTQNAFDRQAFDRTQIV